MPEKIQKQKTSGCIDQSINEEANRLIEEISREPNLISEFKKLIGDYRFRCNYRDTAPNKSDQIRHLDDIINDIDSLISNIELAPGEFKALASESLYKLGRGFYEELEGGLLTSLYQYRAQAEAVSEKVSLDWPDWIKNTNDLEYELLANVFALLRPHIKKKGDTVEQAEKILKACLNIQLAGSTESLLKRIPKEIKNLPARNPK